MQCYYPLTLSKLTLPGLASVIVSISAFHSWATVSRSMLPSSAFRDPVSQSATGTGSPYSGTGLVLASAFLFIPVLDWLDARQFNIPTFKKGVHSACPYWWKIICKCRNAGEKLVSDFVPKSQPSFPVSKFSLWLLLNTVFLYPWIGLERTCGTRSTRHGCRMQMQARLGKVCFDSVRAL
jgi:hypothetical protein